MGRFFRWVWTWILVIIFICIAFVLGMLAWAGRKCDDAIDWIYEFFFENVSI